MEQLAFIFFSVLSLGGGALCVWHRSVVHSAFSLMATLFGVAGFFVLLDADFLAVVQVLLYVGGILVLILFGLMMTKPDLSERSVPRIGAAILILSGAGLWIGAQISEGVTWFERNDEQAARIANEQQGDGTLVEEIGLGFLNPNDYVIPFELASILLLMALVGAVFLARRRNVQDMEEEIAE